MCRLFWYIILINSCTFEHSTVDFLYASNRLRLCSWIRHFPRQILKISSTAAISSGSDTHRQKCEKIYSRISPSNLSCILGLQAHTLKTGVQRSVPRLFCCQFLTSSCVYTIRFIRSIVYASPIHVQVLNIPVIYIS